MRIRTGGMKKGYKYLKKRFWYNNGNNEILIFEGDDIPSDYHRGRLKDNRIGWSKGLTKETSLSIKKMSETRKLQQPKYKYSDEFLLKNYIENHLFEDYWNTHGYIDCCRHFKLSEPVVKRILSLGKFETAQEHSKKVKYFTYSADWRKKHSAALKGKNTWSKGSKHSNEQIKKFKEAHAKRTKEDIAVSKLKEHETRIKTGSYKKHITREEEIVKKVLLKYFDVDDIKYQYFDQQRYPFECDFYVQSKDLFIEVNAYPSHGGRRYTGSEEDLQLVELWKQKISQGKKQYQNWLYTWTDLDIRKYKTAYKNNLNYIALYNINELEGYLNDFC